MTYLHYNSHDREAMMSLLGSATAVLLQSDRKNIKISAISAFILPFARLSQLEIFRGEGGYPAAYMTWAYVTDQTIRRLQINPSIILDIEDLNSGDQLVVFDIVSVLRNIRPVLQKIKHMCTDGRDHFFAPRFDKHFNRLELRRYTRLTSKFGGADK